MTQWACGSGDFVVGQGGNSTNQAETIRIELEKVSWDGDTLEEIVEEILGYDVVTTALEFIRTNARFRGPEWTWVAYVPAHMETVVAYKYASQAYAEELTRRLEALYRA